MLNKFFYVAIGIVIGLMIALIIGIYVTVDKSYMEKSAIQNGCGEYNNTTSEFQWINKKGL